MARNVNTVVKKADGWKSIITGPDTGVFTAGSTFEFCQSDFKPGDDFVGHRVRKDELISFNIDTETLYVRSTYCTIVLSADIVNMWNPNTGVLNCAGILDCPEILPCFI